MIHLRLIRLNPKDDKQKYTHGSLFIKDNNGQWLDFCHTLEDQVRDINKNGKFDGQEKKVYGETAIPFSPKDKPYEGQVTYSNTFKRKMPLIKNVPEFSGIRIHGGNDIDDTYGCILVARNIIEPGKIQGSMEKDLTNLILQNDKEGKFTIEII